jgi:hypothetical protein
MCSNFQRVGRSLIAVPTDDCGACDSRKGVFGRRVVNRNSRRSLQCPSYVPHPSAQASHLTPLTASHTGIGLLSLAINELESHPIAPSMTRANPLYSALQCYAHYGKLDKEVKDTLKKAAQPGKRGEKALKKLTGLIAGLSPVGKASVTTTRAVDLIKVGS